MGSIAATELERPQTKEFRLRRDRQWKQTALNRYERPLDDLESFFMSLYVNFRSLSFLSYTLF